MVHVGGTMTPVMLDLAKQYEKETGISVEVSSAGSGELLATIEMQKVGDLYVSHDPFMDMLMRKKLAINAWTIGELVPVLIVQKGNPKGIKGVADLARDDVVLYLTDYQHSTLGHMLPKIFEKAGIDFKELNEKKRIHQHRSGSHVANMVKMRTADAALVWQAVAYLRRDDLDSIPITEQLPIPGVDALSSATGKSYILRPVRVTISSLSCSSQKREAEAFAAYIRSETGMNTLKTFGFGADPSLIKQEYANGVKIR